jgi:hypothetical protein
MSSSSSARDDEVIGIADQMDFLLAFDVRLKTLRQTAQRHIGALWYLSRLKYDLISSAYADLEVVIESHNESLKQALQLLRDLPNVQVQEAFEDRNGSYIITVISTEKGTRCHKCGKHIEKPNGHAECITLRHLDILGKQVYLRIRLPRFQCDCDGRPTTTQ